MSGFIDELNEWLDSLSDDELFDSWEKSTKGMRNSTQYSDFFSQGSVVFECLNQYNSDSQYQIEQKNILNNNLYNTPENSREFSFFYYE